MSVLRSFEETVVDLLAASTLEPSLIANVKAEGVLLSYKPTGNGYFLDIGHPALPVERHMCTTPLVIGEVNGIRTGFVLFIQDHRMTIECHGFGDQAIPWEYRDQDVKITAS